MAKETLDEKLEKLKRAIDEKSKDQQFQTNFISNGFGEEETELNDYLKSRTENNFKKTNIKNRTSNLFFGEIDGTGVLERIKQEVAESVELYRKNFNIEPVEPVESIKAKNRIKKKRRI